MPILIHLNPIGSIDSIDSIGSHSIDTARTSLASLLNIAVAKTHVLGNLHIDPRSHGSELGAVKCDPLGDRGGSEGYQ